MPTGLHENLTENRRRWYQAMKAKGHSPVIDEERLAELREEEGLGVEPWRAMDMWVIAYEIHNGPGCSVCGWSCCEHCDDVDKIPDCDCIEGDVAPAALEAS